MYNIDQAFVTQFQDAFHLAATQRVSRLENLVNRRPGMVTGESFTVDVLGNTSADINRTRHSDLTYADLALERRFADMVNIDKAELVDDFDKLKLIIEPTSGINQQLIAAVNRAKDLQIINAALGSVRTKAGTTALPAGQKIANGGTGLTLAKLRTAKALLDDAEMDDTDWFARTGQQMATGEMGNTIQPAYVMVCTTNEINDLLGDSTVTNADYNSIRALVSGSINTYMGFWFVRVPSTALPISGGITSCFAYAPRAIQYGVGLETSGSVERIAHKDAWQILAKASVGAARAEDAGVVQIDVN